jgi:nitrogen fixation protein NifU and related proteins
MDDLSDLYQELILDHGKRPRNATRLSNANREADGHNPLCGDKITVFLSVTPDGHIADASFEGKGCAISVASASMMTEMMKGKSSAEAQQIFTAFHTLATGQNAAAQMAELDDDTQDRLNALAGVRAYPMRVKCATLAWHTLQAALCPLAPEATPSTTELAS